MPNAKLYSLLAQKYYAYAACQALGDSETREIHKHHILNICERYLPSGSGINSGTTFNFDNSSLLFNSYEGTAGVGSVALNVDYQCMDDVGNYCGWVKFILVVSACLINEFSQEFYKISDDRMSHVKSDDPDCEHLLEYLNEVYHEALEQEIEY